MHIVVKVKFCCLTGRVCESIYLAQSKNHDARTNISKNEKNRILQEPTYLA